MKQIMWLVAILVGLALVVSVVEATPTRKVIPSKCLKDPFAKGCPPCLGCDRDEHGCIGSAGYEWCASEQKCYRNWEETCEPVLCTQEIWNCPDGTAMPRGDSQNPCTWHPEKCQTKYPGFWRLCIKYFGIPKCIALFA